MNPYEVGGLSETFEVIVQACAAIELFCKVSGVSAAALAGIQGLRFLHELYRTRNDL